MEHKFYNKNASEVLEELGDNSIDLVLTDPPYIISKKSGMDNLFNGTNGVDTKYGNKYAIQTDYGKWDSDFSIDELNYYIQEYYRVLKKGGTIILFFDFSLHIPFIQFLFVIFLTFNFKTIKSS